MGTTGAVSLNDATRLSGDAGRYSIRLDEAWEIWGPNGGYLAAIALRAAGELAEIPRPASFYCHFLRPPAFAEVDLAVEVLRGGRRSESLSVRMAQDGKPVIEAMVRTAAEGPGYEHQTAEAPPMPPPEDCVPFERRKEDGTPLYPFWANMSNRQERVDEALADPAPPVIREWVRFEPEPSFDDPFVDAARSLILLDTFGWPATWMRYRGADYVAPSLDVNVLFHRSATDSDWLLIDHEAPVAGDGLIGAAGRVWDLEGQLVASGGAQLLCIPK
jgi:acyl-CoA thioesterase-2